MKAFLFIGLVLSAACGLSKAVAQPRADTTPILIELFTSEGCSSCPPADAWLQQIDATQPVPGAQLIVLSEHVDYWDRDGWKDPFSSHVVTERQMGYVRAMGLSGPYTPQAVVDGKQELHLDRPDSVIKALSVAMSDARAHVTIGPVTVSAAHRDTVQMHIDVDGTSLKHNSDVYLAMALDHANSQVLRGENGGRSLTHIAVVQDLVKVGRLKKERASAAPWKESFLPAWTPICASSCLCRNQMKE